jgi:hypothetical protein
MPIPDSTRWQWVWWGWLDWHFAAGHFRDPLNKIYRRYIRLGPVELREWTR